MIDGRAIRDADLAKLESLECLKSLTIIDCPITDEGVRSLINAGELEELARGQYVCPVDLARSYVGTGNEDRALAWLNQAADLRCARLIWTVIDPSFESVWTDQRFSAIRSRMNL